MTEKFRASHLLIKFCDSRNPISRRTGESTANVTLDQAKKELENWAEAINAKRITFEEAARQRSDCGSYANGGDLGYFGPNEMMKPFEDAVRQLKIGEMSGVVQTDSGLHIIKRTGEGL